MNPTIYPAVTEYIILIHVGQHKIYQKTKFEPRSRVPQNLLLIQHQRLWMTAVTMQMQQLHWPTKSNVFSSTLATITQDCNNFQILHVQNSVQNWTSYKAFGVLCRIEDQMVLLIFKQYFSPFGTSKGQRAEYKCATVHIIIINVAFANHAYRTISVL